jgi:hypothetical protein
MLLGYLWTLGLLSLTLVLIQGKEFGPTQNVDCACLHLNKEKQVGFTKECCGKVKDTTLTNYDFVTCGTKGVNAKTISDCCEAKPESKGWCDIP